MLSFVTGGKALLVPSEAQALARVIEALRREAAHLPNGEVERMLTTVAHALESLQAEFSAPQSR